MVGSGVGVTVRLESPIHLGRTFGHIRRGLTDPCCRIDRDDLWIAAWTPAGSATLHVRSVPSDAAVILNAVGDGTEWLLGRAKRIVGAEDDDQRVGDDPRLATYRRSARGMRVVAIGWIHDFALATVLEQRVTTVESRRAWRGLVWRHGTSASRVDCGPELRLAPSPERVAALPDWEWKRVGVEMRRARTAATLAAESSRLARAADVDREAFRARLRTIRGVGPWTEGWMLHFVAGDPDAVPVGDWHIPGQIGAALAGEPKADDARMLELLEPWRGQRARVMRWILGSGNHVPRRAPRAAIPDRGFGVRRTRYMPIG